MSYGDLPVKFYTGLRVIGGLTGEDLADVEKADWIIMRRDRVAVETTRVRTILTAHLRARRHKRYVIDYPDTPFQNRETPQAHLFRTAGADVPRITIYGRR